MSAELRDALNLLSANSYDQNAAGWRKRVPCSEVRGMRFMGSFDLQPWTRIGAMNRGTVLGSAGVPPASRDPKTETRRRDASAPRRFKASPACRIRRASCHLGTRGATYVVTSLPYQTTRLEAGRYGSQDGCRYGGSARCTTNHTRPNF